MINFYKTLQRLEGLVQISPEVRRGYECIGLTVKALETSKVFRVYLKLYDAENYVS